ncbi:MAG: transglutaminase family protein [Bacteroidetes bacterium]|nr:transglutaminase family protein [Bacteroidota bacterium]
MRQYQLEYTATNAYASPVWGAYLKFLIHPYAALGAQINSPVFSINVDGDWWISNARQKEVSEIYYKSTNKFNTLNIAYSVKIYVPDLNPFERLSLPVGQEINVLKSNEWIIDNYKFIHLTKSRPKAYLSPEESANFLWLNEGNLLDKIIHLRDQVHGSMEFITGVTTTSTLASEVIKLRQGVCQDFTHLFLGLLRNNGVAARYTSGYLHQSEAIRGASQLHAWVECHIPEMGWIGIDPTNKLLCDHNYVKICHGYDYDDCLPVSGVVNSSANQQSSEHQVHVQQIQ